MTPFAPPIASALSTGATSNALLPKKGGQFVGQTGGRTARQELWTRLLRERGAGCLGDVEDVSDLEVAQRDRPPDELFAVGNVLAPAECPGGPVGCARQACPCGDGGQDRVSVLALVD